MYSSPISKTIYVGNIQSISDQQLRDYFQQFGKIQDLYHNNKRAADEWLIDYRFIRFSSDTDMNMMLTNRVDHTIGRIRLDIHPYEAAFREETRLVSDRKICIAHTDMKLNRNAIKKSFNKYGRILNCTCVSSGNGVEYAYIEFESINSIQSVFGRGQNHFVGRIPLAVKRTLRPSIVGVKTEPISIDEKDPTIYSRRLRLNSNVETAQYSSALSNHHRTTDRQLQISRSCPNQLENL